MRAMLEASLDAVPARRENQTPMLAAWGAIALVSAVVRVLLIDLFPLSEAEASLAVRVLSASQGQLDTSLSTTGAPLFAHLMALIVWVFGASDVSVRIVPALAGVGLALTPALLTATIGRRAALCAAFLIAVSPVAIQVSRMADPAMITAALAMLVVGSMVRLMTDRPWWSPWTLSVGIGLGLADSPGIVVALGTAVLAAGATWGASPRLWLSRLADGQETGEWRAAARPVAVGAGVAVVAATGAAMDLSGLGFAFGELWGGAAGLLTPAPFPTRNLATILVYGWPIFALAVFGFVSRVRAGDRLALFLGQWTLILIALAAVAGQSAVSLAVLPIAPAALLAGIAIQSLAPAGFLRRLSGAAWAGALVSFLIVGAVVLAISQSIGAGRGPQAGLVGLVLLVAVVAALWRWKLAADERGPALVLFLVLAVGLLTVGSIGRLSFGGSPRGSEPLPREMTDPEIRAKFHELGILASADPSRVLPIDPATPDVVRWYGRAIPQTPRDSSVQPRPFTIRQVGADVPGSTSLGPGGPRTAWKTISILNRFDLHPLGVARWAVSRVGLLQGRPSDIIITR